MISLATPADYPAIIALWERSVRATHKFLPEDYLQHIKSLLPGILPSVKDLYVYRAQEILAGFAGAEAGKLEMLFIDPDHAGKGIGKAFTHFCIQDLGITRVDVNEQNQQAVGFYQHLGFVVTGRTDADGMGKPFPILQMEIAKPAKLSTHAVIP